MDVILPCHVQSSGLLLASVVAAATGEFLVPGDKESGD
jgi:hypothetical protein